MAIELTNDRAICTRCGREYSRRKGYFATSYASNYKGIGYLSVCRTCVDALFEDYFKQCNDERNALRQLCRKLDLYWNDGIYDVAKRTSTTKTIVVQYLQKLTASVYAGKSYDDTLKEDGSMWGFVNKTDSEAFEVTDDIAAFWGSGYTPSMYKDLEQRREYWMSRMPEGTELDIGAEAIIRQICSLELDINRDRAAGKSVDKNISALNTLLGSASLKPAQKKEDGGSSIESTPFGVWIKKIEDKRPVKEVDPELKDVDGIIKYVDIWVRGHLAKMLGKKNAYSKLYEEEIAKLRVEHPEFDDDDDETLFNDVYGE